MASLVLTLGMLSPTSPARAEESTDVLVRDLSTDAMATNVADDGSLGVVPVNNPEDPTLVDTDPYCMRYADDVHYPPNHPDLIYKDFTDPHPPGPVSRTILTDRYDPPYVQGKTYPVLMLAHGGGWFRGCRWLDDDLAHTAANDGAGVGQTFIAYSIDYRLACPYGDSRTVGTPLYYLCGWTYQTVDTHAGGQTQVAVHDVMDAVTWARAHANDYCSGSQPICWNNKVYLAGGSAGGNLSLMAAAWAGLTAGPNSVAVWSGSPELSVMGSPNPVYGCTNVPGQYPYETNDPAGCWTAVNQYLGCVNPPTPGPDPACQAAGLYAAASPLTYYQAAAADSLPPPFFANGGGPVAGAPPSPPPNFQAGPELVALQESDDLNNRLLANHWSLANYQRCTVDTNLHGTAYLNIAKGCDLYHPTFSVWKSTLTFLLTH